MADSCYALASKWEKLNTAAAGDWQPSKVDIAGWSAQQSYVFLEKIQTLERPLSTELVDTMGSLYGYTHSQNVELVSRFFIVGLKAKAQAVYKPTAELLGKVGRMKFVRPLYRELVKCDEGLAKETFEKNKSFYHPICRAIVEKDLFKDGRGG